MAGKPKVDREKVREMHGQGMSDSAIGKVLEVYAATITRIRNQMELPRNEYDHAAAGRRRWEGVERKKKAKDTPTPVPVVDMSAYYKRCRQARAKAWERVMA